MGLNTDNFIQGSSYDLQDKWIKNVAGKYFNVEDLSTLRIGLFGYLNEIMGDAIEDNYNYTNFLSDETLLSLSRTPKSIYEYANRYNVKNMNATPSYVTATVYIPLIDIYKCSSPSSETSDSYTSVLTLSKNCVIMVNDEIPFMMDYPLSIYMREIVHTEGGNIDKTFDPDNYSFTCRYQKSDDNINDLSNVVSPYLKCFKIFHPKYQKECLAVNITLRQVSLSTKVFNIYSESKVDLINFEVPYTDQLASFNVNYYPSGSKIPSRLVKYFNSYRLSNDDVNFCYYRYNSDNELQIYFSGLSNDFRPAYNSKLEIEVYTTLGSRGTFNSYNNENIVFKQPSNETRDYQDNLLNVYVELNGGTTGGSDMPSLSEIKEKAQQNASTRNVIITESNLNTFFNELIKTYNQNGSLIKFYKSIDDILQRLFSAFIVLYDSTGEVIPSNTVSIKLDENNIVNDVMTGTDVNNQLNLDSTYLSINIRPNTQFSIIHTNNEKENGVNIKDKNFYDNDLDVYYSGKSKNVTYVTPDKIINDDGTRLLNLVNKKDVLDNLLNDGGGLIQLTSNKEE